MRTTILLVLAGSFGLLLFAALFISRGVLLTELSTLGEQTVRKDLERAIATLNHMSEQLYDTAQSRTVTEQMRSAAVSRTRLAHSSLETAAFDSADVQLIALFDSEGKLIHGHSRTPAHKGFTEIPWELESFMRRRVTTKDAHSFHGIHTFNDALYLVAGSTIVPVAGSEEKAIWLVMSRRIDTAMLQRISERSGTSMTLTFSRTDPPYDSTSVRRDGDMIVATTSLLDIENREVATASVSSPDQFRDMGIHMIYTLLAMLAAVSTGIFLIALFLIKRRTIDRINSVREELTTFARHPEDRAELTVDGDDELGALVAAINTVLIENREQEDFLQELIDSIQVGVLMVSAETRRVIAINRKGAAMIGREQSSIINRPCHDIICPEKPGNCPILDRGESGEIDQCNIVKADGTQQPVLKSVTPVVRRGATYLLESFMDISELEKTRKRLEDSVTLYRTILMNTGTATILIENNGLVQMANSEFIKLTGVDERAVGERRIRWMDFFHPDDIPWLWEYHQKRRNNRQEAPRRYETRVITKFGAVRDVEMTVAMVPGTDMSIASILDITERKLAEKELAYKAFFDRTTDLPNRQHFTEVLSEKLQQASHEDRCVGIILLDLDEFKTVNDSFGHHTGDMLLYDVGQRLSDTLSEELLARLGGDEFGLILTDIADRESPAIRARNLLDQLSDPFTVAGQEIYLGASIGIAISPEDGTTAEEMIRSADLAMYTSKAMGKNTFSLFSKDMNLHSRQRFETETALRRAIERQELEVWYQPKIQTDAGDVSGMEALIRWRQSDGTLVPPGEFIPLAESTSLIRLLDRFVMETACHDALDWMKSTGIGRPVSVNLSAKHFIRDGLVESVTDIVERTGLPPELLDIEITETTLMENFDAAVYAMTELAKLGITFSLDDFGTGYSSLYYLKSLPFNTLKIDRIFVDMIDRHEEEGQPFVSTILSMARQLEMNVVAEGVETREQLRFLKSRNCSTVQGFLFSPPVPRNEFEAILNGEGFTIPE